MRLVHKSTGKPVEIGEKVKSFRGDPWIVTGWKEPHNINSTGRIYVRGDGSVYHEKTTADFYPTVFNCEWREKI